MAASLSDIFKFYTHWIPSHLDRLSYNQFSINGNNHADRLANRARVMSSNNHPCEADLNIIRENILCETSKLLWKITRIIKSSSDGPSSDDFSSANANQIIPRDNLRYS